MSIPGWCHIAFTAPVIGSKSSRFPFTLSHAPAEPQPLRSLSPDIVDLCRFAIMARLLVWKQKQLLQLFFWHPWQLSRINALDSLSQYKDCNTAELAPCTSQAQNFSQNSNERKKTQTARERDSSRERETDFTTFSHRHTEHPQPSAHTIFNQASNGSYGSIVTIHCNNFSFWDRQQSAFLCSSVVGSLLYFPFICKLLWPQKLWASIWLNRTQRLKKCLWFVAWRRCVRLEMECVCVWIVELVSRLEEGVMLLIRHR